MVDRAVENFSQFFAWKIWQFKKSAYLCNRNQQTDDSVAQLVEQMTLNHWVESSSLSGVTQVKQLSTRLAAFFVFAPRASWFWGSRNLVGITIQHGDSEKKELFVGNSMQIRPEEFDFCIEYASSG